ncbi:MAG TPA: aldo/keto reductase [Dehalococcoidia bacterium]|nr:aldo/keto reductase [Dehalococcoidia bacterium]
MKYREFGKTGLRVPEIGFGCGPSSGLIVYGSREERRTVLARALDLGVDFFDTAPMYGNLHSEENLGETLQDLGAHPTISTKVSVFPEDLDDIPAAVHRSVEASLKRLGVDTIDIYYLHSMILDKAPPPGPASKVVYSSTGEEYLGPGGRGLTAEQLLGPGGVADAFDQLKAEGKVRCAGVSIYTGDAPAAIHRVIDSGRFDCAQIYHNILNPTAAIPRPEGFTGPDRGQTLPKAAAQRMGVAVIRPLELGALTGVDERHAQGKVEQGPEYERNYRRSEALSFLATEGKQTLAQAALRYCLSTPGVSTIMVGFSNVRQIEEAAEASDRGPLPPEDMERINALYRSDFGLAAAR